VEAHRRIAALFDRCLISLAEVEVIHQSTGVTRHLCKEVTKVNFGVLNFFEHPADSKTEHRFHALVCGNPVQCVEQIEEMR
jgi:hypothetical protein